MERPRIERSPEERALFNPALLSLVLVRASQGHFLELGRGLPFELAFLSAPVVLVGAIRSRLPRSIATSLPVWLEDSPDLRLDFAERASAMAPLVREAIVFGASSSSLRIQDGHLVAQPLPKLRPKERPELTEEVLEILDKAKFVGRWYARAGESNTIMALWGVRP